MNFSYNLPIFNHINIPSVQFRANPAIYTDIPGQWSDSYSSNPLYDHFFDKNKITQLARTNPQITNTMKNYGIRLNVNMPELEKLKSGHLMDTRVTVAKMYSALPKDLKDQVNLSDLQEAAMLHDYGKVLIPDKILNKEDKLTAKEMEIMQLHPEFGYELLKHQGVNENVLNLIKYHHQNSKGTGYPQITGDFKPDISTELLTTADKYAALTEKRSYKDALSKQEALDIIKQDVDNGTISQEVYNALIKTV